MPQVWKVSRAFQSTNRDTKEPDIIKTQGGDMHKYMVQVEGQPIDGWLQILKKPGNAVNQGDELYGDIVENNWGKPQFNRAQRPQEGFGGGQQASAPRQASSQPSGSVEEKLDYLISLVENFLDAQEGRGQAQTADNKVPTDIDDGPVDLSSLDY